MRKIPTLFALDERGRNARDEVTPGCEWVLAGEGVPTRKWDGTCCLIRGGKLYKRMEWDGKKGPAPEAWLHHDFDPAARSGHGWYPVGDGPEDWMHREAWKRGMDDAESSLHDGTHELVGPKINKNPEGVVEPVLVPHGRDTMVDNPRTFDEIKALLSDVRAEGIVWHHPDGRMAKIKRRDFGIRWPA